MPFGSLWAPFWLPLAPFWLPLAPFGSHFCSLWLTFWSFWLTFTPFSHFGRLLASFLVPFRYFQRKSNEKSCFSMFFSEFPTFYAPASAKHLQTNRRNPSFAQRQIFAYIYLSRPGADNCRRQLRSTFFRTIKNQAKLPNKAPMERQGFVFLAKNIRRTPPGWRACEITGHQASQASF